MQTVTITSFHWLYWYQTKETLRQNISRDRQFIMIRWSVRQDITIIIKYHKVGGLKQRKFVSHFCKLEAQDQCFGRTKLCETCRGESFLDSFQLLVICWQSLVAIFCLASLSTSISVYIITWHSPFICLSPLIRTPVI